MTSPQQSLFHETLGDAVGAAIAAAGGFKRVASTLWPAMKLESGYARLKACMDDGKPEKLTLDEIVGIARLAKEQGSHAVMNYLAADLGYEVRAVEPRDQSEELRREVADLLKAVNQRLARIERVETKLHKVG